MKSLHLLDELTHDELMTLTACRCAQVRGARRGDGVAEAARAGRRGRRAKEREAERKKRGAASAAERAIKAI